MRMHTDSTVLDAAAVKRPETSAAIPVVQATGLTKRYQAQTVVDGIDFTVHRGECFGLLGPNGAGKTTTLRMLLGLTPPTAGTLRVLDWPVPEQARAMRARVGVVPQFDNLDPDFTVRENLVTYGRFFGLRGAAIQRRVDDLLAFVALESRAGDWVEVLSGGMKRRLTVARALVNDPALVVLDEPTTGLDPQARQHLWKQLRDLLAEQRTLILTTHYMEEAERLCDRIAIMDGGRIVACDTPDNLVRLYIDPHVVEVRGAAAEASLVERFQAQGLRAEWVGETVFVYERNRDRLLAAADAVVPEDYLYRPANLEDVFLSLTGRDLRD